jgi:ABC-type branched-subunit amino acid transport system ATPase component
MSVLDNVMAAIPDQIGENLFAIFIRPRRVSQEERKNTRCALAYLEFVGLADKTYQLAGELSFAEQKQLSLARLIATRGSILLFDEPASGMDVVSTGNMQKMIIRLAEFGKTICVVEHNLDLVKGLSDESLFMNQGDIIRKAKPEELMADPQLAQVYFGG